MQICSPARASVVLLSVTNTQILLKVIRVEGPLHFSEDLKHLVLDQIPFAKRETVLFSRELPWFCHRFPYSSS